MIYSLDAIVPEIHPSVWVAETAVVIGKVVLEQESSIWFGAVLRGDNDQIKVGRGSNVQENAVLHTDKGFPLSIGENCTIGHKAMLHGCSIGAGTLIGMGATILNGAKIGKGCLIGACALITEGKEIPDGSLVMGAPAKLIRDLDPEAQARLLLSAAHYRAAAQRMVTGLVRVG